MTAVLGRFFWAMTFCVAAAASLGADYRWTGAISAFWTNAANWSPNGLPGAGDSAFVAGDVTLPSKVDSTVYWTNGAFYGDTTIEPSGALLLVGPYPHDWYCAVANAGLVEFVGNVRVSPPFSLVTNRLINTVTGIMRKSGGTNTSAGLPVTFENQGRVEVLGGTLSFGGGGVIGGEFVVNEGAALKMYRGDFRLTPYCLSGVGFFGVDSDSSLAHLTFSGVLSGPMTWIAGTITGEFAIGTGGMFKVTTPSYPGYREWACIVTNAGLVDFAADMKIYRGSMAPPLLPRLINTLNGTVRKSGGTNVPLEIPVAFENHGRIEVFAGTMKLQYGGVVSGEVGVSSNATLRLAGGSFDLKPFKYSGSGFFGVDGNDILGFTGVLDGPLEWRSGAISGSFSISPDGSLTLRKTGPFGPGWYGSVITNSGLLEFATDFDLCCGGILINAVDGVLRKSGGTNSSTRLTQFVENHGTIEARSGLLQFSSPFQDRGGAIKLFDASLQVPPDFVLRGELSGTGVLIGSVTNRGTIRPGNPAGQGPGVLTIQGEFPGFRGDLTQMPEGALAIELGGITPGVEHGQLVVAGNARLHGAINVSRLDGYLPAAGDAFRVLTATRVTGSLPRQNGLNFLGDFRRVNVSIGPTAVDLTTETLTEEAPMLHFTTVPPATLAWPVEFEGWHLLTTLNFNPPVIWTEVPACGQNFVTVDIIGPQRYWRLVKP